MIMRSVGIAGWIGAILLVALIGCSSQKNTLAVIGSDSLAVPEFEEMYLRTRVDSPSSEQQKREFLDLLVDFKVKRKEAHERGFDSDPALRKEIRNYRDQLAFSYLFDKELIEPGAWQLYERRKEEVRCSHIIVKWERDVFEQRDTLATLKKALRILDTVRNSPLPFDSLVMHFSDETTKEETRGDIGWVLAGTTLPMLDDMLFSMKPGEVHPQPLRSPYGYHIIKFTGRKSSRTRVHASQILYRLNIDDPSDTAAAYAHLSLILDSLKRGLATFEQLAMRNSQDPVSGAKGGELGWVDRGTYLEPRFEEALFNLKVGETSPVVRSAFGMHIIRLNEGAEHKPFEDSKEHLKQVYQKERFWIDYRNLTKALREKNEFTISSDVVRMIASKFDSSVTTSTPNWDLKLTDREKDAFLFRLNGKPFTVRQAIPEIKQNPSVQMKRFTKENIDTIAINIADQLLLLKMTKGFEEKYPEFARLVREYEESSIIGRLEEEDILSKVELTEAEERQYWEQHREEFRFPDRVSFSEIYVYGRTQAQALIDSLKAGADFNDLASRNTRRPGYFEKGGAWGFLPIDKNELSRAANEMQIGQISEIIAHDIGFSILKLDGRDTARVKTFEEARMEVIGRAKQEKIKSETKNWIGRLREKHRVVTFPENLRNAFTKPISTATVSGK